MNIIEVSISRLREYENNPRNNDLAVEKIKYSIKRFGFLFPVIIDTNYVLVCGHTRVRACRELRIESVPCIIAEELTEDQINLFRLVDNKTSEYSDWDFEKLRKELSTVDLTLDKNRLLIERFELNTEVFDIEPEQAEIKIPSFNFLDSENELTESTEKRPTISTIRQDNIDSYDDMAENDFLDEDPFSSVAVADVEENEQLDDSCNEVDMKEPRTSRKENPLLTLNQFRFGDTSFFISKVELDRLNAKYAEYIDSGDALKRSFVDYLLKGVEKRD